MLQGGRVGGRFEVVHGLSQGHGAAYRETK